MITATYVRTMARYNAWQNSQLMPVVDGMDQAELDRDRGAFFGSIQGTLSHLLWGDLLWMSRFDPQCPAPEGPFDRSRGNFPTRTDWLSERAACDSRIRRWADALQTGDLDGAVSWYSEAAGEDFSKPLTDCIVHVFNHQIHHRGQVHAMLTAAGQNAPVTDLPFMPEHL
ncbi:DinB family protein [Sulfitobacter aestuariivivens]|uniref:DinB family protein n=1 Tax=Sulfitobacter aestuariivivens TaxID=2766981 RepID=A0A927D4P9_9RHOB|nr:DinB family protein [Sulfitobacter aestuariivivens]MBD3663192.1 DinB family protein [Sulfitobacter aestuariivivens]